MKFFQQSNTKNVETTTKLEKLNLTQEVKKRVLTTESENQRHIHKINNEIMKIKELNKSNEKLYLLKLEEIVIILVK